jgi:hypothetical protein
MPETRAAFFTGADHSLRIITKIESTPREAPVECQALKGFARTCLQGVVWICVLSSASTDGAANRASLSLASNER